MKIYLIGSLRNPEIPAIGRRLREDTGWEVFDSWFAAGPIADDSWQAYEKSKGVSYPEALEGYAARHVFGFDVKHLLSSDGVILVLPAGKSGHLEFGWALGLRKHGAVFFSEGEPDRWDVMYQFAGPGNVHMDYKTLIERVKQWTPSVPVTSS